MPLPCYAEKFRIVITSMPFFSFVVEVYEESKCNVLLKFALERNESRFLLKVSKKLKVVKTYNG
jgi:hypothetical protein